MRELRPVDERAEVGRPTLWQRLIDGVGVRKLDLHERAATVARRVRATPGKRGRGKRQRDHQYGEQALHTHRVPAIPKNGMRGWLR